MLVTRHFSQIDDYSVYTDYACASIIACCYYLTAICFSSCSSEIRFAKLFIWATNRRIASRRRRRMKISFLSVDQHFFRLCGYVRAFLQKVYRYLIKLRNTSRGIHACVYCASQSRFHTVPFICTINRTDRRILTKIFFLSSQISDELFLKIPPAFAATREKDSGYVEISRISQTRRKGWPLTAAEKGNLPRKSTV